jgi:uncharacterized repeat protein (TIGR01451 family)
MSKRAIYTSLDIITHKHAWLMALLMLIVAVRVDAAGTPASTLISHKATATYEVSGVPATAESNTDTIQVDELIDVTVVSQDAANIAADSPEADRVLTFEVTNTGNGLESFELTVINGAGDQFDVTGIEVYLDANGNAQFDVGTDTPFTPGSGGDTLALDANAAISSRIVFVVSDIPAEQTDGDLADVELHAISLTARVNALNSVGDAASGQGDGSSDAVVNASVGRDMDQGAYFVSMVLVALSKSSDIDNAFQTNEPNDDPIPGATITYTIGIAVSGSGTAANLVVQDPIPANTSYVPGSMTVDTGSGPVSQVDVGGSDEGELDAVNGKLLFDFGDVVGTPVKNFAITFQVTIE